MIPGGPSRIELSDLLMEYVVTSPARPRRDPLFGAAVLKLTFQRRQDEQSPQFREIYNGVLRDLKVTDEQVEAYLAEHLAEVETAIRARLRGESGDE